MTAEHNQASRALSFCKVVNFFLFFFWCVLSSLWLPGTTKITYVCCEQTLYLTTAYQKKLGKRNSEMYLLQAHTRRTIHIQIIKKKNNPYLWNCSSSPQLCLMHVWEIGKMKEHLINLKMYRLSDRQISFIATPMMDVKTTVRRRWGEEKGFSSVLDRKVR